MIAMNKQYNSIKEVVQDMRRFLAIDYPVRCTFEKACKDHSEDVIIGLPFYWGCDDGVDLILIDGQQKYNSAVGRRFGIPFLEFQYMHYEPIEVTDFNWQAYLPEKKRLREEDE